MKSTASKKGGSQVVLEPAPAFDFGTLLFATMVFGQGLMAEKPEAREACGKILKDFAGSRGARMNPRPRRRGRKRV